MKWMLITPDYPPKRGGVARYLEALVKTCDRIELEYLQKLPGRLSLLWLVYRHMKQSKGIITSHVLPIGTMCWLASKLAKKPYIVILHGMDFDLAQRSIWKRFLLKRILKKAKIIAVNTMSLASEVKCFAHSDDIIVVYPTVSDAFVEASSFIHAKHTSNKPIHLLTVARLVERKGHEKVLSLVRECEDLHYTIVGDGVLKTMLEEYIKTYHLQDRVKILSTVADQKLPHIYANADIFIMPTTKSVHDREGFGIVYLEAQLFQLPVISVDHPGVNEAVKHRVGGLLIQDSKEELIKAIEELKDPAVRIRMGKNGSRFVKDRFIRQVQCEKFCEFLSCE